MNIITMFDPTSVTSGSFDMTVQVGGHVLVINESSANIVLNFGNGANTYVPANDRRIYAVSGQMAQPHTTVTWTQQSTLPNPNNVNQTVIEAFQPGETVPETYPSPIVRNTSVAGSIKAIQLELLAPATPYQDILLYIDTNTGLINADLGTNGVLSIGNSSPGGQAGKIFVESPTGSGGTEIDAGQMLINLISPQSGNDMAFHIPSSQRFVITVNGTDTFSVNTSGIELLDGTLSLLTGSLSRIAAFGPYAVTTTPTNFNHNLGVTPDLILLQPTGGVSTTRTCIYNDATMTTTQVSLTANSSFNVRGLALKF